MVGMIVRLVILAAVIFGIVYALTRKIRSAADKKAIGQIQDDVLALKTGIEEKMYSQDEYQNLRAKIMDTCEKQGIDIPDLPARLPERETEGGAS